MSSRQRIDWSVLPGVEPNAAVWSQHPGGAPLVSMITQFSSLFDALAPDELAKHAIELALDPVGLVRAGFYFYDEPAKLMLGSWGTALDGQIVDEHHAMFSLCESSRRLFERATSGEAHWTVIENCPLIDLQGGTTEVVGRGWVVCTPIHSGGKWLGMLYNDAGLSGVPVNHEQQAQVAVLCSLVASSLRGSKHSNQYSHLPSTTAKHPVLRRAVHLLARDPSLGGELLATQLELSLSRLARLFKEELGTSLVDYRNSLRLERFASRVFDGESNLLEAAIASGFGSYAQFHRVFRSAHGIGPREYFTAHGIRLHRRH